MNDKNNATCAICGKEYVMCYSCDKGDASKHWKLHCDTPEHYKIFQIIHAYTSGVYTDVEAAKKLEKVDLSDFDELRDNIKEIIGKIRSSVKPNAKVVQKADKAFIAEPIKTASNDMKPSAKVVHRQRTATLDV